MLDWILQFLGLTGGEPDVETQGGGGYDPDG